MGAVAERATTVGLFVAARADTFCVCAVRGRAATGVAERPPSPRLRGTGAETFGVAALRDDTVIGVAVRAETSLVAGRAVVPDAVREESTPTSPRLRGAGRVPKAGTQSKAAIMIAQVLFIFILFYHILQNFRREFCHSRTLIRHSGEGRNPLYNKVSPAKLATAFLQQEIPAFAGMTGEINFLLILRNLDCIITVNKKGFNYGKR